MSLFLAFLHLRPSWYVLTTQPPNQHSLDGLEPSLKAVEDPSYIPPRRGDKPLYFLPRLFPPSSTPSTLPNPPLRSASPAT